MTSQYSWAAGSGSVRVELVQGDITEQHVDAIVNAANAHLGGGGGVDGAIHRKGGPTIMEETRRLYPKGCPTGSAVITGAGNLHARHVMHAVGPIWRGGESGEPEQLAGAYRTCLSLAAQHNLQSIAFPSISTGAYYYPVQQAARVALTAVKAFLDTEAGSLQLVRFVLFDKSTLTAYERAAKELWSGVQD